MTHGVEKQPSKTFQVINYKENTLYQQIDKENFNECIPEVPVCVIHKGPDVKNSVSDCREFKLRLLKSEGKYYDMRDFVSGVAPGHTEKHTVRKVLTVKTADIILLRFIWMHCQLQFVAGKKLSRNSM